MFGLSQRNNSENAFTSSFLMVSSVNVELRVSSDFSPDLSRSDSAAPGGESQEQIYTWSYGQNFK